MRNRGILTREDREIFQGEKEVDDDRLQDIRWNVDQRMDRIERDLEILEAAGEDELVDDFYDRFGMGDIIRRVRELERRADDGE